MKPNNLKTVALWLIFCLGFTALGFKACTQSEKDRNIAWAKDVASSLQASRAYIQQIKPALLGAWDKGISLGNSALAAIQAGNASGAVDLITELLPIFNQAAALFTSNPTALAALALADIGLHFLLNHLPQPVIAAAKQRAQRADVADPITEFKNRPVWGCDYRPEKCKN